MSRAVMQQALEALDGLHGAYRRAVGLVDRSHDDSITIAAHNAGASLRAAIAEPENQSQSQIDAKVNPAEPEHDTDCHLQGICQRSGYSIAPTTRKPEDLTDEEIALIVGECAASAYRHNDFSFARAVIAAYEAKNGITGEGA